MLFLCCFEFRRGPFAVTQGAPTLYVFRCSIWYQQRWPTSAETTLRALRLNGGGGLFLTRAKHFWALASPSPRKPPIQYTTGAFFIPDVRVFGSAVGWAKSRKVAGSIPDGVIGIFHWHNPSGRTVALGSTQPLTRNEYQEYFLGGGKGGRCGGLIILPPSCADCLAICEPQTPRFLRAFLDLYRDCLPFPKLRRPGRETDFFLPHSADVRNACSFTSLHPYIFNSSCTIKNRVTLSFIASSSLYRIAKALLLRAIYPVLTATFCITECNNTLM